MNLFLIREQIMSENEQMFPCEQGEQKQRKLKKMRDIMRMVKINLKIKGI